MVKNIIIVFLVGLTFQLQAQNTEEQEIKAVIDQFFENFHARDSSAIKTVALDNFLMQTIGTNQEGAIQLRSSYFNDFLQRIVSMPEDQEFEEKLLDYKIRIDGSMANAWTPYEFWFNGEFSHCGVNSFQLIRKEDGWKIFYIVDTRRREGCGEDQ